MMRIQAEIWSRAGIPDAEFCAWLGQYCQNHILTAGVIREAYYWMESKASRTVAYRDIWRGDNPVKTPKDTEVFRHSRLKSSKTRCYKGPANMLKNNSLIKSSNTEDTELQLKGNVCYR